MNSKLINVDADGFKIGLKCFNLIYIPSYDTVNCSAIFSFMKIKLFKKMLSLTKFISQKFSSSFQIFKHDVL